MERAQVEANDDDVVVEGETDRKEPPSTAKLEWSRKAAKHPFSGVPGPGMLAFTFAV